MILFGSMYTCESRRQRGDGEEAGEGSDVIVFIYRAAWVGKGGKERWDGVTVRGILHRQTLFTRIKKEGDEDMT